MATRDTAGLDVLLRSQRRARPASVRDLLTMASAAPALVVQGEALAGRLERLRAPLAESGRDALIRASRGPRGSAEVGNELEDRLNPLNASWLTLKADFSRALAAGLVTAPIHAAFLLDYNAWVVFYDANIGNWIVLRSTLAEVETRRLQLERWRTVLTGSGGTSTGVATLPPAPGLMERAADSLGGAGGLGRAGDNAARIAGAVAIVAVVGVVGLLIFEGSAIAKRVT